MTIYVDPETADEQGRFLCLNDGWLERRTLDQLKCDLRHGADLRMWKAKGHRDECG